MKSFFKTLNKTFIIAEIGVNHNNSLSLAKKLIRNAKKAGADAVKFQTFKAKDLVLPGTRKVRYQLKNLKDKEDHFQMIKKLELSYKKHKILFNYCKKLKIEFLSTPYDVKSARFLKKLGVKLFKTASADLIDFDLHNFIASSKRPVIISTGMSSIKDINETLKLYKRKNNYNLALLHCVSNYPCSLESINLNAIQTLKKFKHIIGYSDHSKEILTTCLAVSLGSKIIEKHFTLDKNLKGPDHKSSFDLAQFSKMVKSIRKTELILGNNKKIIQPEEKEMSKISKKSLYFKKKKEKNTIVSRDDLVALRPGEGINPFFKSKLVGKKLKNKVYKNQIVEMGLFK